MDAVVSLNDVPVPIIPAHSTTQFCLEDLVAAHEEGRQTMGHIEVTHHLTEACLAVCGGESQVGGTGNVAAD